MERLKFGTVEQAELWERRRAGESVTMIARHTGIQKEKVRRYLKTTGGIRPRPRVRSPRELGIVEREEISRGIAAGLSCRAIAQRLGRAPSTVSREVRRNRGRDRYRATVADEAALGRARRPKPCKLAMSVRLQTVVEQWIGRLWSPRQISLRLKVDYPDDMDMRISPETIYVTLFVQSRGGLRKELTSYLRSKRTMRAPKRQLPTGRGQVKDKILISERPAEAADRAVPGHWEGDLLRGKPTDAIGTLVERSSRYTMLVALPNRITAEAVRKALEHKILDLPLSLRRSLTWDQGWEMSEHARFTIDTGLQVYFCDPRSPWQRGTNENTNGLLRQYFPKNKSLRGITQQRLDEVADQLNGRPRETLAIRTPAEKLTELLGHDLSSFGGAPTA